VNEVRKTLTLAGTPDTPTMREAKSVVRCSGESPATEPGLVAWAAGLLADREAWSKRPRQ
jgi:hypothetical protein